MKLSDKKRQIKISSVYVLLVLGLTFASVSGAAETKGQCDKLLSDSEVERVYKQNALNQLALEFGKEGSFVYDIVRYPVDDLLVKIESYARYQKMGQKELARSRLKAWVSRCNGTTIIRGNTWLADGTLKVVRYSEEQLKGQGLVWGDKNAPMKFIVYVDSRCPHCHRLIDYARKLVEQGKVVLDVRQVAYLEDAQEAIQDTRLLQSSLVMQQNPLVDDKGYLDMLEGNNNVDVIDVNNSEYKRALKLIKRNTETAEKVLHVISVPSVLVQEREHNNLYRKMGYWEVNRIFQ